MSIPHLEGTNTAFHTPVNFVQTFTDHRTPRQRFAPSTTTTTNKTSITFLPRFRPAHQHHPTPRLYTCHPTHDRVRPPPTSASYTMTDVTLTNPTHLTFLLELGAVWEHPLALRHTITRTTSPEAGTAPETVDLTITAQPRLTASQHPQLDVEAEYDAEIYGLPGPVPHLWTGVYHMIEERGQRGIFGPHYTDKHSLMEKLSAMLADFNAGRSVHFYFSDLGIADEFGCYGLTPNPLADAIAKICQLASSMISPTDVFQQAQHEDGPQHRHVIHVYDSELTVNTKLSSVKLSDADEVDGDVAKAAADLLVNASIKVTGADPEGYVNQTAEVYIPKWLDRYAWEYPASQLVALASTPTQHAGVRRYAKMAGAIVKSAAQRTKSLFAKEGIASEDMLHWVAEFVGKREAALMAAVESDGGVMRGVRDLSYSSFSEDSGDGEGMSIAATVSDLRDVGRLGWGKNVVESGAAAGPIVNTRLVVQDSTGDAFITIPLAEGTPLDDRLPGDAVVR